MTGKSMDELQDYVWKAMEEKGFHKGRNNSRDDLMVLLALVHTEVSEATQEVKRHWSSDPSSELVDKLMEEIADAVIRLLDLAGCLGRSLATAVDKKMVKNIQRPHLYGTPQESAVGGT